MDDIGLTISEKCLIYQPRNVRAAEVKQLEAHGYIAVPIYWRVGGFPFIVKELLTLKTATEDAPGQVLKIEPVGTHTPLEAAQFISRRMTDIYESVIRKVSLGGQPAPYNAERWRLGPVPGPTSPPPAPVGLRRVG